MENELQVEYRRRNRSFSMDYFYEPGTPRTRLEREAGISLSLGHSGLDDLVQGSVLSMIDRVLPNGALA